MAITTILSKLITQIVALVLLIGDLFRLQVCRRSNYGHNYIWFKWNANETFFQHLGQLILFYLSKRNKKKRKESLGLQNRKKVNHAHPQNLYTYIFVPPSPEKISGYATATKSKFTRSWVRLVYLSVCGHVLRYIYLYPRTPGKNMTTLLTTTSKFTRSGVRLVCLSVRE